MGKEKKIKKVDKDTLEITITEVKQVKVSEYERAIEIYDEQIADLTEKRDGVQAILDEANKVK